MLPRSQPFALSSSGDAHAGDFEDISTRTLQSVRVGQSAGKLSSGYGNAFVGYEAGKTNVQGSYNAMVGFQAGAQNGNASFATMVGAYAGAQNQRGNEVTFVGYKAGELSRDGNQIVGIGAYALRENVSGNGTVAVGYRSAERTLDGYFNTMIGTESGQDNRSGNFNTMAGYRSGRSAFLGNENTYLGAFSGYSNRRGSGNSFVGYRAGEELQNGDFNVAIGAYSMQNASSGSCNIAIGPFAGAQVSQNASENVLIGTQVSANGTPNRSVVLGAAAGATMSGDGSVLIGYQAGKGLEYGNCNILIGTGATTYTSSNVLGIAIGSFRTLTFTNSLSIGNDIVNQREYSILMGNDVSSDADNSIIVGKANTIESFVVWKDPISESLQQAVLLDGQAKIGLCNIDYSDTVVSPCNQIYAVAMAKIFTSNQESSLTNPPRGKTGPTSYDLRQYVPEHILHNGLAITVRDTNEYSWSNQHVFLTSNAVISSSKPLQLSLESISFEDVAHNTSTYQAIVSLQNHSGDSNIAVNIRNLSNISSIIPITCALRHVAPIHESNVASVSLSISAMSNMQLPQSLANLDIHISCNINDGVFLPTSNELRFVVERAPRFGMLDRSIYTSIADATYTPFPECSATTEDDFVLRTHYFLQDNTLEYGVMSQDACLVQVRLTPSTQEFVVPNYAVLSNHSFLLDSNVLRATPPILTQCNVYVVDMPTNYLLYTPYRASPFTSNEIQRMLLCNIYDYPAEAYPMYLHGVQSQFSNVNMQNQMVASNLSVALQDIVVYSTELLTQVSTQGEIDLVNDISAISLSILGIQYPPTQLTSNATVYLSTKVNEWNVTYDPGSSLYVPWSQLITASNQAWYEGYLTSGLYDSWLQTQIASNAFDANLDNPTSLSNIVTTYHADVATSITFDVGVASSATQVYTLFDTMFQNYFQETRLFLMYDDVLQGHVYFASNLDVSPTVSSTFALRVADASPIHLPIQTQGSTSALWNDIALESVDGLYFQAPYSSNCMPTTLPFDSFTGYSSRYIMQPPQYGRLQGTTYVPRYPWASNDAFTVILENTEGETVDLSVQIQYDTPAYRSFPITLLNEGEPLSNLISVNSRTYDQQTFSFSVSNTTFQTRVMNGMTTDTTWVEPIATYDPNIGYLVVSSNENITIIVTPLPNLGDITYTCNLYEQHYTFDTLTSTWTEYPPSQSVVQATFPSASILDFASNIDYTSSLVRVASNYYAYTSNISIIDRDDLYYEYRDTIQNMYVYTASQVDIPRSSEYVEISLTTQLATTPSLTVQTTHYSSSSNFLITVPYFPITKHHVSFPGHPSITFSSSPGFEIVRSNIGPETNATWEDIEQSRIWVRGGNSGNINTSLGSIMATVVEGNAVMETIIPTVTLNVPLDTFSASMSPVLDACVSRFVGGFSPWMIHVYNVQYGYLNTNGSNISTNIPWIASSQLRYVPRAFTYQDTIYLFFRSLSGDVTNLFKVPIYVNFTSSMEGQAINMGVSKDNVRNVLHPSNFFYSYNNLPPSSIQVQLSSAVDLRVTRKTGNVFINVALFTMQEVKDGRIFIEFTSDVAQSTLEFDVRSGVTTLVPNQSFPIYRIQHYAHPPSSLSANDLPIDFISIGSNLTYESKIPDILRTWYQSLVALNDVAIPASSIEVHVWDRPRKGVLVHIQTPSVILAKCTVEDMLQNKIRYVSHDPDSIEEDYVGVRFVLPSPYYVSSSTLRLHVRQFYSHFHPYAMNVATLNATYRTIPPPPRSITMQLEGYVWESTCNTTISYQNAISAGASPTNTLWTLPLVASNLSYPIKTYAAHNTNLTPTSLSVSLRTDQADSVSLDTLSNVVPIDPDVSIDMYVVSPPKHGVIQDKRTGLVANTFSIAQIASGDIIYQHIGVSQEDGFEVTLGTSPYTLAKDTVQVSIDIDSMPSITTNTSKYVYYNSLSESNVIQPFLQSNISFAGDGYAHVLSTTNLQLRSLQGAAITSFPIHESNLYGYRVAGSLFSQDPYPPASFEFSINSHVTSHVNPLYALAPYRDVFVHSFVSFVNVHSDSNMILAPVDRNQFIAYDIDNTPVLQNVIMNKIVTMAIDVYPEASYVHPQFDLFLSDHFTYTIFQGEDILCRFFVDGLQWTLDVGVGTPYTGTLPSSLTRNAWNTLKFVNYDLKNDAKFSIYWKYQSADEVNLLADIPVEPIHIEQCTRYEFLVDIESPIMYVSSSNFSKLLPNGIRTNFRLQNSHLGYHVRNFQVNISTYTVDDSLTYDPDSHNIIIGKDINVQGVDNICVGNKFVTSGNQSIILGNSIGGGLGQTLTTVNDIFQSIIVGNQSFRNSIVRDIICIGNDNFNNLSEEDTNRTRFFFSQKPIVIGNGVDASKIDYDINIGNVFLNTSVNSKQIYLGQDGQCVAIGYSSNEALSASRNKLYVGGSVHATAVSTSQHTRTMICASSLVPFVVVHEVDDADTIALTNTPMNTLVCGVVKDAYTRPDGLYDVVVTTRGKTKVWCKSIVQPGELLVSDDIGCVTSRGADTSIHSFTFAKSLSAWDPNNPSATPFITTSNIAGYGDVGLITCTVLY